MNPAFRFAAVAVLALAGAVAGAGIFGAGQASAGPVYPDPNTVTICPPTENGEAFTCSFQHPNGIAQVRVVGQNILGEVEFHKETFRGCPEKVAVEVSFAAVQGQFYSFEVTPCPAKIDPGLTRGGASEPIVVLILAFVSPDGTAQVDVFDKCYTHFPNCDLASYECQHLGQGCPPRGRN